MLLVLGASPQDDTVQVCLGAQDKERETTVSRTSRKCVGWVCRQTSVRVVGEDTPTSGGVGWGRWSRAALGTTRPSFHASSALAFPRLCPVFPWEGEATPWERPLHALAVRPWPSHLTSLSCSFRPYKMGTITLPKPILQTSCQNQMSHEFQRALQAIQFMRREGYFQRCLKNRSSL